MIHIFFVQNRTLLHWACDRGHLSIVEYLVDEGHDINCKDTDSLTPLHYGRSYIVYVNAFVKFHVNNAL